MSLFIYPPTPISVSVPPVAYEDGGLPVTVTEDNKLPVINSLKTVDFPDAGLITVGVGANAVPFATFRTIVASSAARIRRVQVFDNIGAFIGLYYGTPGSEILACYLGLGGSIVDVDIPAGEPIYLQSEEGEDITIDGNIAINFLG